MNENHKLDTMGRAAQEEGTAGTKAHTLKRKVRVSSSYILASFYIIIKIDFPNKQVEIKS